MKSILSSLALLLPLAVATAQTPDGPYWSEYARPANMTNFRSIGTLAMIETPTEYHFYSGLHRRWITHPVTAPIVLGVTNSYCLFQDGNTVYGFSTRSGAIAALPTSGNITVNIGSASSSWTAYVIDGNTVNGWSGFYGEWKPLAIQGGLLGIGIGSHTLSAVDNQAFYGFSAFFGEWVPTPYRPATNVFTSRNGVLATFTGPNEVRAFSAYRNAWVSDTLFDPAPATYEGNRDGYVLLYSNGGSDALFFSSLAGVFTHVHEPVGTTLQRGPNVAVIQSPNGVFGYAPSSGAVSPIGPVTGSPVVQVAAGSFGAYALIDDGVFLNAFSGLTGNTTLAPQWQAYIYTLGDTAAFAKGPGGLGYAYSALLDRWVLAPADVTTDIRPQFESIVRVTASGHDAFSARTGTFASSSASGVLTLLSQGAIATVVGTDSLETFDPTLGRWEHLDTGSNPTFGVHRLVGVGRDATHVHGYSLFTNVWESMPFQGTVTAATANSSIGYVATSSHYYIWTGNGSLSNHSRFPEFSRFCTIGAPFIRLQCGNPGAFVFALFSFTGGETNTPYGMLRVDSNPIVVPLGLVPANGLLRSSIAIPDDPAFRGLNLHMQDFLIRSNATGALSNAQAPYLW